MAYFARKIDYCACENEFVSLIEIAAKKGGEPIKFVLYRYNSYFKPEMVEFGPGLKKDAKKAFPYGPIIYEDVPENEIVEELPRPRKNPWQKTTKWLYKVGAGGGYQICPKGTWIKIGRPAPWKKRRRKLRLKIGELGHILLLKKRRIEVLHEIESNLRSQLDYSEEPEIVEESEESLEKIKTTISKEWADIEALKSEMRFRQNNR